MVRRDRLGVAEAGGAELGDAGVGHGPDAGRRPSPRRRRWRRRRARRRPRCRASPGRTAGRRRWRTSRPPAPRAPSTSSVTATGSAATICGRRLAGSLGGGLGDPRGDVVGDGLRRRSSRGWCRRRPRRRGAASPAPWRRGAPAGRPAVPDRSSGALHAVQLAVRTTTLPSRSSGSSTDRYSRMCTAGLSNDRPNIVSITIWCDRPMPSVNRPPVASHAVIACWARACGWRGKVGTTAVPRSMPGTVRPATATRGDGVERRRCSRATPTVNPAAAAFSTWRRRPRRRCCPRW